MYRSFDNRVLGGVCGGLAAPLPVSAWAVRLLFIILTLVTLGAFAVVYAALWVAVPQGSLVRRTRGGAAYYALALVLIAASLGGWYARLNGWTEVPSGADLYYPVMVAVFCVIYFLRQLRRTV